jgi:predicted protein tyrosine phosphatase
VEFLVRDRDSIEHGVLVRSSYIVISIRDPDKRKARIPTQSGLRDVLYLAFHDAEPVGNMTLPDDIILMSTDQAKQIWQFVRQWEAKVGAVVVHCEQGMSRSPAVAAALCKSYGGDEACFFREYLPNRYVYRLMLSSRGEVEETRT